MSGMPGGPVVVCVIGTKNSGKTWLSVALIRELMARGLRVMSAKHGHGFRFDTPGTDSWRHRHEGGAARVALVGPEEMALAGRWGEGGEPPLEEVVARFLGDADVVVAEGFKTAPYPKIEVFRREAAATPLLLGGDPKAVPPPGHASSRPVGPYLALVTDDPSITPSLAGGVEVLPLAGPDTVAVLADRVEALRERGAGEG